MRRYTSAILTIIILISGLSSCRKKSYSEVSWNRSPVANAGSDTIISLPSTHMILDGSKSYDPDNRPITYKWRKISGPQHFDFDWAAYNQIAAPSRIDITCHVAGEYLFDLTVTNSIGLSSTDVVKVSVNHSPATEHLIDMLFDINPVCEIDGDFPTNIAYSGANFVLYAESLLNLPGGNSPPGSNIRQEYEYTNTSYFYPARLIIAENSGFIVFNFSSVVNFFTLPYNAGSATFSDSIVVNYGGGSFANIYPDKRLYCTVTADTTQKRGSIRLRGSIYY